MLTWDFACLGQGLTKESETLFPHPKERLILKMVEYAKGYNSKGNTMSYVFLSI